MKIKRIVKGPVRERYVEWAEQPWMKVQKSRDLGTMQAMIELTIDLEAVIQYLGKAAMNNKTRKAREIEGLIEARVVSAMKPAEQENKEKKP